MDKWLKKSVEVDNDESSLNKKKEKLSQSKTRKSKRRKVVLHGMKMKKTSVHDALFVLNNLQTRACVQTNCFAILRLSIPS